MTEGINPSGELAQGADGELYGVCSGLDVRVIGGTLTFGGEFKSTTDGVWTDLTLSYVGAQVSPDDGLTPGPNGNLYGTSLGSFGVASFEFTTNGTVNLLCSFEETEPVSPNPPALYHPPPAFGLVGDLFGVVSWGGLSNSGAIYRIDSNGVFATLYSFTGGADGASPQAALTADGSGVFYGTTAQGGVSNKGTIFRITVDGDFKSLYSFTGGSDGGGPTSELLYNAGGLLYGTTPSGGAGGFGTVFAVDDNGVLTTLYSFAGRSDGMTPGGKLAQGFDGYLYGTTTGGDFGGGTVFRITAGGSLTTLYGFHGIDAYPAIPNPLPPMPPITIEPIPGPPPPLARTGGSPLAGTIGLRGFTLSGGNDGASPSGVILGSDGNLYGTTVVGGYSNCGTIFRLDLNQAPTVDLVAGPLIVFTNSLASSIPYPMVQLIWSVTNQGTSVAPGAGGTASGFPPMECLTSIQSLPARSTTTSRWRRGAATRLPTTFLCPSLRAELAACSFRRTAMAKSTRSTPTITSRARFPCRSHSRHPISLQFP